MTKLQEQTLQYWNLSRVYEGRPGKGVTVEEALQIINSNIQEIGPKRALAKRFSSIKLRIVQGTPKAKKKAKGG